MLAAFVSSHHKGVDFAMYLPGLEDAVRRARKLDEDAESMNEPGRNPTTGFYRLAVTIARIGATS